MMYEGAENEKETKEEFEARMAANEQWAGLASKKLLKQWQRCVEKAMMNIVADINSPEPTEKKGNHEVNLN